MTQNTVLVYINSVGVEDVKHGLCNATVVASTRSHSNVVGGNITCERLWADVVFLAVSYERLSFSSVRS